MEGRSPTYVGIERYRKIDKDLTSNIYQIHLEAENIKEGGRQLGGGDEGVEGCHNVERCIRQRSRMVTSTVEEARSSGNELEWRFYHSLQIWFQCRNRGGKKSSCSPGRRNLCCCRQSWQVSTILHALPKLQLLRIGGRARTVVGSTRKASY